MTKVTASELPIILGISKWATAYSLMKQKLGFTGSHGTGSSRMTEPHEIQGSPEWLEWRKTKVTASELPIILGISKWATAYSLWQQKLGFTGGVKDNYAMKRGRDLEPMVRDLANENMCAKFVPAVLVSNDLAWAAASLDGIDREYENGAIMEIKCPGLADHQLAEKEEVPPHYYPQIQWQLFVADLHTCYYVSYYDQSLAIFEVVRDDDYISNTLLPAAAEFYRCLVEMEEPAKEEDDFIQIVDPQFEEHAREWKAAKELLTLYTEKEKYYKNKLISFTDDSNCKGSGITIQRIARDGSVDWKKRWADMKTQFPQAEEAYPEHEYRKESIGYWKVSQDK